MPTRFRPFFLTVALATLAGADPIARPQAPGPIEPVIDVSVVDASGNPVQDLRPEDLSLSIDGARRTITAVRRVFRGPGAETAALRSTDASAPLAEPSRAIVLAVDERSFARGGERGVLAVISAVVDRLGAADRVAFVRLASFQSFAFTADRTAFRDEVASLRGRAAVRDVMAGLRRDDDREARMSDDEDPRREGREAGAANATTSQPRPTASDIIVPAEREVPPSAALTALLDQLRAVPGPKDLVLLGGSLGLAPTDGGASVAEMNRALELAGLGRVTVHVVHLASQPAGLDLTPLAENTGGLSWRPGRNPDRDLARLGVELSARSLVFFEPAASDLDGRLHQVDVKLLRPGLRLRAAKRWSARPDPLPRAVEKPAVGPATPGDSPAPELSARKRDAELDLALARASEYVAAYFRDFSNVVAEEVYEQKQEAAGFVSSQKRTLKSDFLMVSRPGLEGWLPFRDVFEVDGKPVRDRQDRLRQLFVERPATALNDAREINDESARYNVGDITRNINIPTLALLFLSADRADGLAFTRRGSDTIEGVSAWQVDYEERRRPTLIRGTRNMDLAASGSFWIEPLTGRILKTVLRTGEPVAGEITVTYRRSDSLGLWVPAEMREVYKRRGGNLSGRASYSNFRRFQVKTEEQIAVPKKK